VLAPRRTFIAVTAAPVLGFLAIDRVPYARLAEDQATLIFVWLIGALLVGLAIGFIQPILWRVLPFIAIAPSLLQRLLALRDPPSAGEGNLWPILLWAMGSWFGLCLLGSFAGRRMASDRGSFQS
jgi:hypothetical protein